MELLAPAGTVETFHTALHAGADAVYIGAPGLNARNLARDLTLAEIGAMIEYAHGLGKRVYLAANSLILEKDLPSLAETFFLLQDFQPDGIIVQDLALVNLLRNHFPQLSIHASTLMGCSSSDGAATLSAMGCDRVVLARELTLKEIAALASRVNVELEVFVHGAMCYSSSGLCLFSSFLGGKSGLRGRCVQPCRRGYSWAGRGGGQKGGKASSSGGGKYLFSMNDLEGFEAVAQLKRAGVTSVKIEGRLRSANYIGKIVEAYRGVLDAAEEEEQQAIARAVVLAEEAMGRRTSTGYFFSPQPQDAVSAHHSGNMGLHLGSFSQIASTGKCLEGTIVPKYPLNRGDRLRLHVESTGERQGFTLHKLWTGNEPVESAAAGTAVRLGLPKDQQGLQKGQVELYKVDEGAGFADKGYLDALLAGAKKKLDHLRTRENTGLRNLKKSMTVPKSVDSGKDESAPAARQRGKKKASFSLPLKLWLRTDSAKLVTSRLPFLPEMYIIDIDKRMLSQSTLIRKSLGKRCRQLIWALPSVLFDKDLGRYRKRIRQLIRSGFKDFQLGHISQKQLFAGEKVRLYGDYTLNLANSRAMMTAESFGLGATQVAVELDREAFASMLQGYTAAAALGKKQKMKVGLTVYGAPALFTSRLGSKHFQYDRTFVSPKGEKFAIAKREGLVLTVPQKPFSLLAYLEELAAMGFDFVVVDTRYMRMGQKNIEELARRLSGGKLYKLPTFNYLGKLQ